MFCVSCFKNQYNILMALENSFKKTKYFSPAPFMVVGFDRPNIIRILWIKIQRDAPKGIFQSAKWKSLLNALLLIIRIHDCSQLVIRDR